jgi:putative ABC transport system permease protein
MLSPRWRKILRDLNVNKLRTTLVVLSIAVGVFAVGAISGTNEILSREMNSSYLAVKPAHATIYPEDTFTDSMVETIKAMPDIGEAMGMGVFSARVKVGPEEFRNITFYAYPDYEDITINQITSLQGKWPPKDHDLLLERSSLAMLGVKEGDTVIIKLPDGKEKSMKVDGVVHDINQFPSALSNTAYGYITLDGLEWLGEAREYSQLMIRVKDETLDQKGIERIAEKVKTKVEKAGNNVFYTTVPEPGKHPADSVMQPLFMILGVLGMLALVLSGFLVINTISALLAQQTRQIGMMKAIGARRYQIISMYIVLVILFSLLSLGVALPLGAFGAQFLSVAMGNFLNADMVNFSVSSQVWGLEVAIGLFVPLLTGLYPIIVGTRLSVQEALSTYGLGKGRFGRGPIDKMIERVRNLPRPLLLSLRNTFRRKGRLSLTLITLTLGGAFFIGVFSVKDSLGLTLEDALKYWNYDVAISFNRAHRIEQVQKIAYSVPGITGAESWGFSSVIRKRPDDTESKSIFMIAPPADTKMLKPIIRQGRWLRPDDENAVVVNTDTLKDEKDIKVGDQLVLKIGTKESKWRVVGIVQGVLAGPFIYANYPYFVRQTGQAGRAGYLVLLTEKHDAEFQTKVSRELEKTFAIAGVKVSSVETTSMLRQMIQAQFNIIIYLLLVMVILLAVVGALGLMGTMSINVLERTREIGVMRAIGASDGSVEQIFMVEGMLIGLLSWLAGLIFSLPLSKFMCDQIGTTLMQSPLSFTFSAGGALIWLAVAMGLSAIASYLPARNASRLSVREVLAYE